jgi:alpha-D-xyloside xylohydrolase
MPSIPSALLLTAALLMTCPALAAPPATPVTSFKKEADGLLFSCNPGTLQLRLVDEKTLRVTYAPGTAIPELKSLAVVPTSRREPVAFTVNETPDAITLETSALRAKVTRATGALTFLGADNQPLLQEKPDGRVFEPAKPLTNVTPPATTRPANTPAWEPLQIPETATTVRQSFVLPPEEALFGLGQHQQGQWNYRGKNVRLLQHNTEVGIPVLLSSKGYLLFWDNPAVTEVAVGTPATPPATGRGRGGPAANVPGAGEDTVRWTSEVGGAIDYYFIKGATPDDSMRSYRNLTGNAPMLPRWAWGFFHSKERYRSQAELLEVAHEFRKNNIPIDCLIQDWRYWPDNTWGSHDFDKARYPDPAAMFKELHTLGYHALISVWPKFDLNTDSSKALNDAGAMYPPVIPYVAPPGRGQWYDAMSKAGRDTYWNLLATKLFPLGVDGWWLDAPEPELSGRWGEYRFFSTAAGAGYEVFNAFPLMHSKGIYDGQRAATPDKRVIILTRSAWAGQQRNSAITWSGDIGSSWQVYKNQVPAGLNFVASGIPWWNTDTGGFFNAGATGNMIPTDPRYQEIFTRWFQFSAFCPMFRVHGTGQNSGTGIGKEIYRFPEEPRKNLLAMLDLRYRLLPYIYSAAWRVTNDGYTMMRPLVMDFAGDPKALDIPDQFMFGPGIMACPVTTQGATARTVYLPQTAGGWYDFWTGARKEPGTTLDAPAPIAQLPLFIRAGTILPMGPLLQYTSEKPADPIELRVYRGADGTFALYEDEGDSYRYEQGAHSTIPITWNNAAQTLTIGARQGTFPGMLQTRTFHVVFVSDTKGNSIAPTTQPDRTVTYTGTSMEVRP